MSVAVAVVNDDKRLILLDSDGNEYRLNDTTQN